MLHDNEESNVVSSLVVFCCWAYFAPFPLQFRVSFFSSLEALALEAFFLSCFSINFGALVVMP